MHHVSSLRAEYCKFEINMASVSHSNGIREEKEMFAQVVPFVSEITTNSSKKTNINTVFYVRNDELQILTNIIICQTSFHVRKFMMGKSCVRHTP